MFKRENGFTMRSDAEKAGPDLSGPEVQLPETIARNKQRVDEGFWTKVARYAGYVPFSEDVVAAWYCARDPETPLRVRAILFAAMGYFVVPTDLIPDFILGLGFTDDATVIATAIGLVSGHINEAHRKLARITLQKTPPEPVE